MNQRRTVIGCVLASLAFGVVGVAAAGEVVLLRMPEPGTGPGRAWRLFGLTTLTSGIIAGAIVGTFFATSAAGAGDSVSIVAFAFLEGGAIAGFAGLALGSLVGAVLALDRRRREGTR